MRRAKEWYDLLESIAKNEWREWEPETIRALMKEHIQSEADFNRIMALQASLNAQFAVDAETGREYFYFNNWRVFEKVVMAFNGHEPNFLEVEQALPREIAYAIGQLEALYPVEFSEDVAKYIAASFATENIIYCPFWPSVDRYLPDETGFKKHVEKAWKEERNTLDLSKEEIIPVQIARLLTIEAYRRLGRTGSFEERAGER